MAGWNANLHVMGKNCNAIKEIMPKLKKVNKKLKETHDPDRSPVRGFSAGNRFLVSKCGIQAKKNAHSCSLRQCDLCKICLWCFHGILGHKIKVPMGS